MMGLAAAVIRFQDTIQTGSKNANADGLSRQAWEVLTDEETSKLSKEGEMSGLPGQPGPT